MKKKVAMRLLFILGVFSVFGGCGSKAAGTSRTDNGNQAVNEVYSTEEAAGGTEELESGTVELTIWAEQANFDMLNKMIDKFKEEHAGEAEFNITLAESADSGTKGEVLKDVHNAADIFPMADDQLAPLAGAGALAKVPNEEEIREANLEDAVDAASLNGTLYAYPMTADNGYFLYYDKRYFSEKDVETLDSILTVAAANQKKFTMDWTSGWYLYAFFGETGLEFGINDDGVTNYCNWNATEGGIKGTDIASALLAIGSHPGFESRFDEDFLAGVKDGSVIAGVSGVWNAVEVQNAWGGDYGAVKLPTYTCGGQQVQMSSFKGYKMMGVNYYSKHKEWALTLADYLTNEENQIMRLEERNQGPSNKHAAESELVQGVPAIQAVIDQAQYGKLQRVGNSYWDGTYEFGLTMTQGNPRGLELQDIMDNLVSVITQSSVQ